VHDDVATLARAAISFRHTAQFPGCNQQIEFAM
jgi:hypothetical protein